VKKISLFISLFLFLGINVFPRAKEYPKREMRAAWIATVENIDWPSTSQLTVEAQKTEMIALLDSVKAYNMNTIVFQIRPDADALYASELEPWSEWLTGKQGLAPNPWYDPLQFTINECRKRGIDIHVWLNPYRAIQNIDKTKAASNHVSYTHPDWMLTYGKKMYFDPGIPEVRDHVARVVSDIVRRYDIDAIHFDDYFYPYKISGTEFPDDNSFQKYPGSFGAQNKDDWRRNNVDLIIKQLHDSIKSIKPTVEFGISPFGVWRNKKNDPEGSETRAGVSNYDDLYADILKWQKEKWIDYVTPQLYWYIGKEVADYAILAKWWAEHSYGCNVYIGQAPYLIDPASKDLSWRTSEEITKQISLNRRIPEIKGSMFFSAKFLKKNPLSIQEKLLKDHYKYQSLTPVNPLGVTVIPAKPINAILQIEGKDVVLSWQKQENNSLFVVYRFKLLQRKKIDNPDKIIYVTSYNKLLLGAAKGFRPSRYRYVVTALSPSHTESDPVKFKKN
jgi:uncharacterized lipoprotein YddW (UPF0748 family)